MELRHVRYFIAVAQERSFSRAAKRLNISQPPLTRQIKDLEEELGVLLFERSTRSVTLTPAGAAFLQKARAIIYESTSAVEAAQSSAHGVSATLHMGFMSSIMLAEFAPIFAALHAKLPSVAMRFSQMRSDLQLDALIDHRIDVGFVDLGVSQISGRLRSEEIVTDVVLRDRIVVCVPYSHHLAKAKQVSLQDLRNERFAILERHLYPAHYDTVIAACKKARFTPDIAYHGDQLPTVLTYAASRMAVCFAPACSANSWSRHVAFVPLRESIFIDVHMLMHKPAPGSPLDVLRTVAQEVASNRPRNPSC